MPLIEARLLPMLHTRSARRAFLASTASLLLCLQTAHAQNEPPQPPLPPYAGPVFQPSPEAQIVIDSIAQRYETRTVFPSTWDIGKERYPLEPASAKVLEVIASAFEHIEPLVGSADRSNAEEHTSYPQELRIYTLRGLAGSPGGGYADDMIQLTIPGSITLHDRAPRDIDGIQRQGTVEDEIAHATMHEVMHRFTVLHPALYEDYVRRFWKHNKDNTWSIKDRRNLSGYRGEPNPWEIYADELASVSIPIRDAFDQRLDGTLYGYRVLSQGTKIFLLAHPELRPWAQSRNRSDIFTSLPRLFLPMCTR